LFQRIADQQRQRDPAVAEDDPLKALMDCHVMGQQLIGQRLELRPQGQSPLQIRRTQRVLFDTDKMQPRSGHCVLLKQLPGAEKIQPGAKPGFTDHQSPVRRQRGKALGQAILFEEHVTGFIQPRLVGKIHIVEHPRARASLVIPVELGVGQYRFHGRLGNDKAAILADWVEGA